MKKAAATLLLIPALATPALLASRPAQAHPHVWVTVQDTVLYDHGAVTGVRHTWTFDEFYAAQAIEGLDKNNDGQYDRQELAELAQVNIDGLQQFEYFTFAKLNDAKLTFAAPKDYWLDYANNILTLHFTLPLEQPALVGEASFAFSVYDPTYFIAFELAKDNPVKLADGAPAGCAAAVKPADVAADQQSLTQAFAEQLSPLLSGMTGDNTVEVRCGG